MNKGFNENAQNTPNVSIRWLIYRDIEDVLDIETQSFKFPWTREEFRSCLDQRNCMKTVATLDNEDNEVVGFIIYELHTTQLRIVNFAVHPDHRRRGVGKTIVNRLIDQLSQQRRNNITLEVRETNLDAQLFFHSMNFKAFSVLRKYYDDTSEDAYCMQWILTPEKKVAAKGKITFQGKNRITEFMPPSNDG